MTEPKPLPKLGDDMRDGERKMWLVALRSPAPLSDSARRELADILERQWFPPMDGGRPGKETWTSYHKASRALRAWHLRGLVEEKTAAGVRLDVAEEEVAASIGLSRRALQEILRG